MTECVHIAKAGTGGLKLCPATPAKTPDPDGKAAKTRAEILKAAARVLRDNGYKATTLRKIAEEADMKAGSVYYHFDSKEAIVDEVLNAGLRDLLAGVESRRSEIRCPVRSSRQDSDCNLGAPGFPLQGKRIHLGEYQKLWNAPQSFQGEAQGYSP